MWLRFTFNNGKAIEITSDEFFSEGRWTPQFKKAVEDWLEEDERTHRTRSTKIAGVRVQVNPASSTLSDQDTRRERKQAEWRVREAARRALASLAEARRERRAIAEHAANRAAYLASLSPLDRAVERYVEGVLEKADALGQELTSAEVEALYVVVRDKLRQR